MSFLLGLVFSLLILAVVACLVWWWLLRTFTLPIRAHEVHLVTTKDLWKVQLCRFRPKYGKGEPVLLCHGLMANHFNFETPEGLCLVDTLMDHGYDCWLLDLRGNRSSIPPFGRRRSEPTLDDSLNRDIPAAIEFICKATGYPKIHWIGHSMGGMLLYAYDQVFGPERIASGTTLGSPTGFTGVRLRDPKAVLVLLRISQPIFGVVLRSLSLLLNVAKPKVAFAPINWNNMHPEVAGQVFFNMLEAPPYRAAADLTSWASHGVWRMQNHTLDIAAGLKNLRVPLFAIFGVSDPLAPLKYGKEFFDNIPHSDKELLILGQLYGHSADYNHVDLAFGKYARKEVFEPIVAWLRKHPVEPLPRGQEAPAESPAPAKKSNSKKRKTPAKRTASKMKAPSAADSKTIK
ncbi:MAG: alpha/beta fold hydrolase, partial [Candidatus Hydrogenedentes bacterium]|nr:alpha/beta fold hydrolase [Candidatus Hydrogenedentota bacterium]